MFFLQNFANDIAVLRIPLAPCQQKNICPVCINDLPVGAAPTLDTHTNCFITGWGPVNAAGTLFNVHRTKSWLFWNEINTFSHTLTE